MSKESDSSYLSTVKSVAVEHMGARVDRMALRTARTKDQLTMEAERFIVRHPWRAVGIAAGIGLIAGSLIAIAPRTHRDS
ncbi:MAG: DUF883 C-terminal domain-containing protein [Verrucomicrobiota bacterium]